MRLAPIVVVVGSLVPAVLLGLHLSRADPGSAPEAAAVPLARIELAASKHGRYPTVEVAPLPGWPKWAGELNHQISGLAYRDGRLYAVSDQSGAWKRAILEFDLSGASSTRTLPARVVCRWRGGPHPDAEGLAIDPLSGPPHTFLMPLESLADVVIEVGAKDCEYLGAYGPLAGKDDNEGIEGIALSPDGKTLYLTHETKSTLLTMTRGETGPANPVAKIRDADSLCDLAYDDRGTSSTDDDRLLLLDRNGRQIFETTTSGEVTGRWVLEKQAVQKDPDGHAYTLVSLEGLAIESREVDGSVLVYASTDTPPPPYPYHRKDHKDPVGLYLRRIGMLYRFRLPPFTAAAKPLSRGTPAIPPSGGAPASPAGNGAPAGRAR